MVLRQWYGSLQSEDIRLQNYSLLFTIIQTKADKTVFKTVVFYLWNEKSSLKTHCCHKNNLISTKIMQKQSKPQNIDVTLFHLFLLVGSLNTFRNTFLTGFIFHVIINVIILINSSILLQSFLNFDFRLQKHQRRF